jgi:hypothetical protein
MILAHRLRFTFKPKTKFIIFKQRVFYGVLPPLAQELPLFAFCHLLSRMLRTATLQCQNQPQDSPPAMTSTSIGPTIDLSKDDKVTVVTRCDVELRKKPLYRIATVFYLCCHRHRHRCRCRCHRHCILLLLLPLLLTATVNCHLFLALPLPLPSAAALHCNCLPPPHRCNNGEFCLRRTSMTTMTTMPTTTTKTSCPVCKQHIACTFLSLWVHQWPDEHGSGGGSSSSQCKRLRQRLETVNNQKAKNGSEEDGRSVAAAAGR